MKISFLKREIPKAAVLAVLALVAVAGVVTGREKPALELVQPRSEPPQAVVLADIDLGKLKRNESLAPQNDPFARRSFAPERVAPPARAMASAPITPPLPFRYFGRLVEQGKLEVFVMRGDEVLTVAAGQKIDSDYRVDRVTDTAISFTYLPLKTRQTLDLPKADG